MSKNNKNTKNTKNTKNDKNNNKQLVVYRKIKWDLSNNKVFYFDFSNNKIKFNTNRKQIYLDKCRQLFDKDDENYTINPLFSCKNNLNVSQKKLIMSNKKYNKYDDKCKNVYNILKTLENDQGHKNDIYKKILYKDFVENIKYNAAKNNKKVANNRFAQYLNRKHNTHKTNKTNKTSENNMKAIIDLINEKYYLECDKNTITFNKPREKNDEFSNNRIFNSASSTTNGTGSFSRIADKNTKFERKTYYKKKNTINVGINQNIKKVNIEVEINGIKDILKLIDDYPLKFDIEYNINMRALHNIKEPLVLLDSMIGMNTVKENVVDQILYYVQDFHKSNNNDDFMHTVIYGPPGTGKTEVAKIIGKIFSKLGVLKKNVFKKVTRADLIAGYLGQTAIKTKDAIESALGGVLFIDEAYALGNSEKRDIFAKECIDTLCEALSDNKNNLMVIIAGYEKELKHCFFEYNKGLDSRFPWRYKTDDYKPNELRLIFNKKINEIEWKISDNVKDAWFEKNKDYFKFYGRDMETLLSKVKIAHSRRVFCLPEKDKKTITEKDMDKGFNLFISNDEVKKRIESNHNIITTMYM